jgi:hypothetical protein
MDNPDEEKAKVLSEDGSEGDLLNIALFVSNPIEAY